MKRVFPSAILEALDRILSAPEHFSFAEIGVALRDARKEIRDLQDEVLRLRTAVARKGGAPEPEIGAARWRLK